MRFLLIVGSVMVTLAGFDVIKKLETARSAEQSALGRATEAEAVAAGLRSSLISAEERAKSADRLARYLEGQLDEAGMKIEQLEEVGDELEAARETINGLKGRIRQLETNLARRGWRTIWSAVKSVPLGWVGTSIGGSLFLFGRQHRLRLNIERRQVARGG